MAHGLAPVSLDAQPGDREALDASAFFDRLAETARRGGGGVTWGGRMNTLWYGDCLTVMQGMPVGSVDLIYLDPPFNSSRNYHAIYQDETGRPLPDQIEAFCDMWTLTEEREREIRNMPILVRDTGIPDDVAEFWRVWTGASRVWSMGALRKTNPAAAGVPVVHGDPTGAHARSLAGDWEPVPALRLDREPLHQGYARRRIRPRQLPK